MRIGVLGTGAVGTAIATKLVETGHEVRIGSRTADNAAARAWSEATGRQAGTFAAAAESAELVFNCTAGAHSLAALEAAGEEALADKPLVDVANALDFSGGVAAVGASASDSLGERIQRAFPRARVVKALNTVNNEVMVDPACVPGEHGVFVCGDDAAAKQQATGLLGELGWSRARVIDLGPLSAARATETYMYLWLSLMRELGTSRFNIEIRKAS